VRKNIPGHGADTAPGVTGLEWSAIDGYVHGQKNRLQQEKKSILFLGAVYLIIESRSQNKIAYVSPSEF
jgi:hypothetical protein